MHKLLVLIVLILAGCAAPLGKGGGEAMEAALQTPAPRPTPPPKAVEDAVMEAVRPPREPAPLA